MDNQITQQAVDIILKTLLTSMIYMVEHHERVDFIYFSNNAVNEVSLKTAEQRLKKLFGCEVELVDIKMFDVMDRLQVMKQANMIYCENDAAHEVLELAVAKDLQRHMHSRVEILKRRRENGVFYLQ